MKNLKLLVIGIAISFFGSMAPGTLNMTTIHVSAFDSLGAALWFVFGAIIIEMFYAAFAVTLLHRIQIPNQWKKGVQWLFVIGLISYGGYIVYTELFKEPNAAIEKISFTGSAFIFGISISFVTPSQMPFWMFWGTLLKRRNILEDSTSSILIYTLSAGIGAASLLVIYAFLGVENRDWINANQFIFMIFYGSVFLMIGLYQAWRNIMSYLRGSVVE